MSVAPAAATPVPEEAPATASKKSTQSEIGVDKASAKASQTDKDADGAKASEKTGKTEKEAPTKRRTYYKVADHQCGLEKDGVWQPTRIRKRITTSQATPEEAAMYQRIIDSIMHPDTIYGKRVNFNPNDVIAVMIEVQPYLASEPVLIEDVPLGMNIVGDLHGQLYDLERIFRRCAKDGKPGYLCSKFLFMGDYVDRGKQSLEIIMLLFCLKMLYPDNFFLLRGNHEFVRVNSGYGFAREIFERYCEKTFATIYAQCNETFMYLSLAAIIGGNKYLCVHAGISSRQFNREELRNITKPIVHCSEDFLIQDMLWSDPAVGLRGTVFNYGRGNSFHFGLDALVRALHDMDCIALFRGHSVMTRGFENLWDICFTVFSCTGGGNDGAVCYIDENGKLHTYIMQTCESRNILMDDIAQGEPEITIDDGGGDGAAMVMGEEE